MATSTTSTQTSEIGQHHNMCVNLESVNRIAKLPVVESTIQTATNIYEKVKDYNSVTHWTLSTAESTVNKTIEVGKPVVGPMVSQLEGPIKKVDGMLCHGLDYVEAKVPAVKLPPGEMYTNTKEYVNSTVGPTVQSAYAVVQPAVEGAMRMVEPLVQPALQKVGEMLHPHKEEETKNEEGSATESKETSISE